MESQTQHIPQDALKTAKAQAQLKPLQDRIIGTESFLERARKRAGRQESQGGGDVQKASSLSRKRKSAARLLAAAAGQPHVQPPTVPADFVKELSELQSFVEGRRGSRTGLSQRFHQIW